MGIGFAKKVSMRGLPILKNEIMNRLDLYHYSIFLFVLLVCSAVFLATLLAQPLPLATGGVLQQEDTVAFQEKITTAQTGDWAATRQREIQLRYGMAGGWVMDGLREVIDCSSFVSAAAPLPRLVFDSEAILAAAAKERLQKMVSLSRPEKPSLRGARKFKTYVDRYAAKFQVKPNLVFAIIKTESNFDTMAASSASAYGLMQLVPRTGGRAAYKVVYGKDVIPTREYLQDPNNNIELGTAYLSHLAQEYFDAVENADSREYCQIAAYNTGPSNVYRTFGGDYNEAIAKINSLSPPEVYEYLKSHLPYAETRQYLYKVVSSQREFVTL
jgi:soluble lytic murein transglycosylase-like protein